MVWIRRWGRIFLIEIKNALIDILKRTSFSDQLWRDLELAKGNSTDENQNNLK